VRLVRWGVFIKRFVLAINKQGSPRKIKIGKGKPHMGGVWFGGGRNCFLRGNIIGYSVVELG
jgi:hypothetical protein